MHNSQFKSRKQARVKVLKQVHSFIINLVVRFSFFSPSSNWAIERLCPSVNRDRLYRCSLSSSQTCVRDSLHRRCTWHKETTSCASHRPMGRCLHVSRRSFSKYNHYKSHVFFAPRPPLTSDRPWGPCHSFQKIMRMIHLEWSFYVLELCDEHWSCVEERLLKAHNSASLPSRILPFRQDWLGLSLNLGLENGHLLHLLRTSFGFIIVLSFQSFHSVYHLQWQVFLTIS